MGFFLVGLFLLVLTAIPYVVYLCLSVLVSPSGTPAQKQYVDEPVSIVLPTYNEASIVQETLESLVALSYPTDQLEIIVSDSSTDRTPEIVQEFVAANPEVAIQLLHEEERSGVATAVNRAVAAASHDIIFRTDCDSQLGAETIRHAVANLQDGRFGAVTGRQAEVLGGSEVESEYRSLQARNQALESALDSTFIIHGPCFAFRRELFQPIPADSLADDTEIAVSIRRQGKRIAFDPEMTFAEVSVSGLRGRRQRKDRRAMGLLQLLDRNRELLGRHRLYGWVVLPVNWWFLAISPWLSIGGAVFVVSGLLMTVPLVGVAAIGLAGVLILLGQRDWLGRLQAPYAVFDAHLSLVIARIRLWTEEGDGTWEVDTDSRELL